MSDPASRQMGAATPTVYIPHIGEPGGLLRCLASIETDDPQANVVVVENEARGDTAEALGHAFPRVKLIEVPENLGFGRALNLGVRRHPGDPLIFLNNDVECRPGFFRALTDALAESGAEMLAAVLLQGSRAELIDSAGVIADWTLMGFDYLNGERAEAALSAPDPLGPTGGAALYSRAAFEAVGGFDENIFLYYEDLDLALRIKERGGRCRLVPGAMALHGYSSTLGSHNPRKYALTGWSRGYMLRRYSVLRRPGAVLRVLTCEGAICAGQMVTAHTTRGLTGRLRGWRAAGGLPKRRPPELDLQEMGLREALSRRRRRAT